RSLVGGGGLQAGQAQVVVPALEEGEGGAPPEQRLDGVDQPRQVVVDQLRLQREGGGGDHHRSVHTQRGDQVRQRLAGAGARLDQQVLPGGHRPVDRGRHALLARPFHAAGNGRDRGREQRGDVGTGP